MSEYISYSTTAMVGGAGSAVREALRKRGIFFHDARAWATARKRAEELEKLVQQELEARRETGLDESSLNSTQKEIVRLESMLLAFCGVPELAGCAEKTRGRELNSLKAEIKNMRQAMGKSDNMPELLESATNAQKRLEKLATDVQKGLCQVEKEVMVETVSTALHDLGYLVDSRGNSLKATVGQTCVWAETNDFGELFIDLSGFSGLSCMKEMIRVEGQFKKLGLVLKRSTSHSHGRPEGGVLVRKLRPLFPEFRRVESKHDGIKGEGNIRGRQETVQL